MGKLTKKSKIIIGVVAGILAAIILAAGIAAIVIFTKKPNYAALDSIEIVVDMTNSKYYVGSEGKKPDTNGKSVEQVEGAVNVYTYDEMFDNLKNGKDVCVHFKKAKMTASKGTIYLTSDIYANGLSLDAYEVVKGDLKKGGDNAIEVGAGADVLIRDLHIFGKSFAEGDSLRTYNNYGSMIKISSAVPGEANRAKAKVIHCVMENSHKVVHLEKNGQLDLEGSVVRNAADTTVSVGTFANLSNTLNSKNNVIINSMTAGILSYCYDGQVNEYDNANTWNVINITGFLDIYNWKRASNIAFIPDTELGGNQGLVATLNSIVTGEIVKPEYADLSVDDKDAKYADAPDKYVHLGILKISTASPENKSIINIDTKALGYGQNVFPIPNGLAQQFMKYTMMYGYFNNVEGKVAPNTQLTKDSLQVLYKELVQGR